MPDQHPTELRAKPQIIHCHQLATCDLPDEELVFTQYEDCSGSGLADLQADRPFACGSCFGYGRYYVHVLEAEDALRKPAAADGVSAGSEVAA